MSIRDESGKIVINVWEAESDLTNLKKARQSLESACNIIEKEKKRLTEVWEGDSYNSFSAKAERLLKEIKNVMNEIDNISKNISNVLRKYIEIDKKTKDEIAKMVKDTVQEVLK